MLEFMNPLGETVVVLPVMEHWSILVWFNHWPWRMKSGGSENPLLEIQAIIFIWNAASALFDQILFRSSDINILSCLVLLTKPCLFHVENTIFRKFSFADMFYQLPCEYLQTFFCRLRSHILDHLRIPSCHQWVPIQEYIQPSPLQIFWQSSWPLNPQIYLVSFQQDCVSCH